MHRIWQHSGKQAGVCISAGLWLGARRIADDNQAGLPGAHVLPNAPVTEAAVMELPAPGLAQFGHPCDRYDVIAVLDGGSVDSEVLARAGIAVVRNASDPDCLVLGDNHLGARVWLVGGEADTPAMQAHLAQGGDAVLVRCQRGGAWVVLASGVAQTPLMPFDAVFDGAAGSAARDVGCMLFAVALAWMQHIAPDTIRQALVGVGATIGCQDVSATLHPETRAMAEMLVQALGLNTAGIDDMTTDIGKSPWEAGGAFIEVNTTPGLDSLIATGCDAVAVGEAVLGPVPCRMPVRVVLVPDALLPACLAWLRRRPMTAGTGWVCAMRLASGPCDWLCPPGRRRGSRPAWCCATVARGAAGLLRAMAGRAGGRGAGRAGAAGRLAV
ncbi:MAG: hypothetical protein K2X55_04755 [Burkholderiaceae bacterium]|nr:hypothetical protein [Burkholderiaceae bacterium]